MTTLELLPNELLDEVIFFLGLSFPPPSADRLHQPPNAQITKGDQCLKKLSLVNSHFTKLVRPHLFSHSCFDIGDATRYLSFIAESDLVRYVTSIVIKGDYGYEYSKIWRLLFSIVTPRRLTLVAPPSVIGQMLNMQVNKEHIWAFEIPFQVVYLECEQSKAKKTSPESIWSPLDALPWSSFLFNESSSLKAYNHYEYFLYKVPSIFHNFYQWVPAKPLAERSRLLSSLANLTSLTYVAVFPFYNHVQLVLDALDYMTNLRSLKIQMSPSGNDRVIELEQRGSMDPSDPWMELATGYSVIAQAVKNHGRAGCLEMFTACDYEMEAVRGEIETVISHVLVDEPWTHDGRGTWTRTADAANGYSTTNDNP